jgi:hypothetical protein
LCTLLLIYKTQSNLQKEMKQPGRVREWEDEISKQSLTPTTLRQRTVTIGEQGSFVSKASVLENVVNNVCSEHECWDRRETILLSFLSFVLAHSFYLG